MAAKELKAVLVVLSNCTDPAREAEFKDWYVNIHLPDVLETPGIIDAKLFGLATPPNDAQSNFLAIYELDTDDVAAVQKSLDEVMGPKREQGRMIDYIQVSASGYYS
jgi:hypothetical protein